MQNNEPQKKDQYYIWQLVSKKLAGKASKTELLELQELLLDNPFIKYSMEILSDLSEPGNGSPEKSNDTPQTQSRDYTTAVQAGAHPHSSYRRQSF